MSERDLIESIKKAILEKSPLVQIENRYLANEVFAIVNSMDEEVVTDYIRHYCHKYIDSIKNNSSAPLSGKVRLISTNVYPLIAPMSSNIKQIHKLFKGCEYTKKFVDKINIIGEEIKLEILESFIGQNKPLKDLYGEVFEKNRLLDIVEEYTQDNRDKFGAYIFYFISHELYNRSLVNKKLFAYGEVYTIISYVIIGSNNLADLVKSDTIFSIIDEQYNKYCESLVSDYVKNSIPLRDIDRCVINDPKVMETFLKMDNDIKHQYVMRRMDYYLTQKKMMSFEDFKRDCIYAKGNMYRGSNLKKEYQEINAYIESLYELYAQKLIQANRYEMKLSKENWTLFYEDGPRVKYRQFRFDDIESEKFRYEIKLYLMDECSYRIKNNVTLPLIKESVNFLYNRNKECDSFAKINTEDVIALDMYLQHESIVKKTEGTTKKRSVNTLAKTMNKLGDVINFLIEYNKKNPLKMPVPKRNPFSNVSYKNRDAMSERTDIIPDVILEQLDKYIAELNPIHQLMYEIFQNTGMRASSVSKLEENCLKPSRYENVMILKYKPYKLVNYNKKVGKLPYEEIIISSYLAEKIQYQIDATKDLREKYNSKYIFLNVNKKLGQLRPCLSQGSSFVSAVNRVIKKNNIVDYDGVFWNFTSRQCRKTLVSIMMDNNATDAEIAYVLGHNNKQTLNRYYKEINEQRLENLNHEFFKKKFGIDIGEENLGQYSEEEKRCLYIDFVTNYRRTALGYCSKPLKDGPCDKQSGASACEKCPRICTGKAFISEWKKLRDDRKRELNNLTEYYNKHNISIEEYCEYKEYQHILYELNLYQDAIDKINEKCNEGE
ncbi:tyrosine-type recombinase/integrase [Clostridium perfringens]|uniref:site-specific integrase n=1 Tax=Clostridium perfringens TaxID=1502 RepID=UPI002AC6ACD7|nr:site-specific integrase [Clostridium perfringens]MDZ4954506.1 tyrosine-type recombinase/integrase [Clostridium perfringens]